MDKESYRETHEQMRQEIVDDIVKLQQDLQKLQRFNFFAQTNVHNPNLISAHTASCIAETFVKRYDGYSNDSEFQRYLAEQSDLETITHLVTDLSFETIQEYKHLEETNQPDKSHIDLIKAEDAMYDVCLYLSAFRGYF